MDEWINKIQYVPTMKYLALKRNENLTQSKTWINLEDTISEISQSHKDKYYMFPLV